MHAVGSVSSKAPYSGSFLGVCNSDRTSLDSLSFCMTEKVVIPTADQIEVVERKHTRKSTAEYLPYATNGDLVPEMAHGKSRK